MQTKRFIGENPKVGIRPVIDGRQGGVRESLEDQTMNMAKRVAELITSTLKYNDGTPVQCVIADSTIGRVPEAAACAEKFRKEGVGLTISVTPCWCYGSETIDYDDRMPKAIWGFNGTERRGPFIWQPLWPVTTRKACQRSVSMVTTFRTQTIKRFQKMLKKSCYVSPVPVLP